MAISKDKKKEVVAKAGDILTNSASAVFVNFNGLSGGETSEMRTSLKSEGVNYSVIKKSLMGRALNDAALPGDIPELPGEFAVAYGQDATTPARMIKEFSKKFADKITIVGGIFEGSLRGKEEMTEIANIPSIPVLKGQFVSMINAPIQSFVVTLGQIAEKKEA